MRSEVIWSYGHQLSKIAIDSITVGDSTIQPLNSVRTWVPGLTLMCPCPFTLVRSAARLFMDCIKFAKLGNSSVLTLVRAFVTSHLDYCNSLLFGVPKYQTDRLQKVLNAAARLFFGIPKFHHISSALYNFPWLPVAYNYRVHLKLLLLIDKALNNQGPLYIYT